MIDKLDISPNCHILTGYNPKKHLELLGYADKDFIDNLLSTNSSFENLLTVLVPEKSLVHLFVIVDKEADAEQIKSEVCNSNDLLKNVYAAIQKTVSNQEVTVIGTVVLPSITRNALSATNFPFLTNLTKTANTDNTSLSSSPRNSSNHKKH